MERTNKINRLIIKVINSKTQSDLKVFFDENPDFNLETTRLKIKFDSVKTVNLSDKKGTLDELIELNKILKSS